jgi:NADH dehydrogenase [ubiquinone] 1 alpha subcomplex assembly factor 7
VEVSPHLSQIQAKKLCLKTVRSSEPTQLYYQLGTTATNIPVFWYNSVQDVPRQFSCFLAHEFFDALPIHKFQVRDSLQRCLWILYDSAASPQVADGGDRPPDVEGSCTHTE